MLVGVWTQTPLINSRTRVHPQRPLSKLQTCASPRNQRNAKMTGGRFEHFTLFGLAIGPKEREPQGERCLTLGVFSARSIRTRPRVASSQPAPSSLSLWCALCSFFVHSRYGVAETIEPGCGSDQQLPLARRW